MLFIPTLIPVLYAVITEIISNKIIMNMWKMNKHMYFRKFLERGRHMEVCFQEFFIFIFKLLFMHHLILDLESIQHDYLRSLKSQSYKQMPSWPKNESVGLGIRGPGVQYSLGVTFCAGIFCFHVVKPLMLIMPTSGVSQNLY